jgi:hypothetical protein
MLTFQVSPQFVEHGRELPVPVQVGVIERCRPSTQDGQVVQGIEHLLALAVRALVAGDDLATGHHLDALDVGLDRHGGEGEGTRHAVGIAVEAHRLVFIHFAGLK